MSGEPSPAVAAARELLAAVADTARDYQRMPLFVRPLAKRGLAKRTGRTLEGWQSHVRDLLTRLERGATASDLATAFPDLDADLGRLEDNYRTAPERAEKGMGRDAEAMARVREASENRQRAVRALRDAIAAL